MSIPGLEADVHAARARVGALVTEHHRALEEARRLRERAQAAGDLAELDGVAGQHEARARALEPEIEAARRRAHEAEVALERARAGEPRAGA